MSIVFCSQTQQRKEKLHLVPERDWSNTSCTNALHSQPPKRQHKQSVYHALCLPKANDFLQPLQGNRPSIKEQLDDHKQAQVSNNRHIMVEILKIIDCLGKQNLAIHQKASHRETFNERTLHKSQ